MLITLSQLPALSTLLKDSMAVPPGHVSLFDIAPGEKVRAGAGLQQPSSAELTPPRIRLRLDKGKLKKKKRTKKENQNQSFFHFETQV